MKKILLASFLVLIAPLSNAMTLVNNTPFTVTVTIKDPSWWFWHTYTTTPYRTFEFNDSLSIGKNAYYRIKVVHGHSKYESFYDAWELYVGPYANFGLDYND